MQHKHRKTILENDVYNCLCRCCIDKLCLFNKCLSKKKKKKKKKIDNGYNLTFSSHPSALPYARFFIKWLFVPVITSAA